MTWNLTAIRSKVRHLTGKRSTNQLSQTDLDTYINTYYRDIFPLRVQPRELWQYNTTFTTTADQGEDDLPSDVLVPGTDWRVDTSSSGLVELWFTYDKDTFFGLYPDRAGSSNQQPETVLYYADKLWWGPTPDDAYTIQFSYLKRPDALSADGDTPLKELWGLAISYGAAVQIRLDDRDFEAASSLEEVLQYRISDIKAGQYLSMAGKRAIPRF
jgi:hypothetical protein